MRLAAILIGVGLVGCVQDWDRTWRTDAGAPDGNTPHTPRRSWVRLPAALFNMGSPSTESCRASNETLHAVHLSRAVDLMSTEVTRQQFQQVMHHDPAAADDPCPDCPVHTVSWHEAAAYCNGLSAGGQQCYSCTGSGRDVQCGAAPGLEGAAILTCTGYRLPTEAEWESAYRAGSSTPLYSGPIDSCGVDAAVDRLGWYLGNAGGRVHAAATRAPNARGLFDMAGNAFEWCHDGYATDLGAAEANDPTGSTTSPTRAFRGGAYTTAAGWLRAAARGGLSPVVRAPHTGLRCARTAPVALQTVVHILMPGTADEFAVDLDGSGPKNQLGSVFATLGPLVNLQQALDLEIGEGDRLLLFELWGESIVNEPQALLQTHAGQDGNWRANFSGSEPLYLRADTPRGSVLAGVIARGQLRAGPGPLKIPLPLVGPGHVELLLTRVRATVTPGGLTDGVLAGALSHDEADTVLLPTVARTLTRMIEPTYGIDQSIKIAIAQMFDLDQDQTITADELKQSALASILVPDIDSDGDGKNDAYSVGLGFSATPCIIQR